jgi:hypothetical protein
MGKVKNKIFTKILKECFDKYSHDLWNTSWIYSK